MKCLHFRTEVSSMSLVSRRNRTPPCSSSTENCPQTKLKKSIFLLTIPILKVKPFCCHHSDELWKCCHASTLRLPLPKQLNPSMGQIQITARPSHVYLTAHIQCATKNGNAACVMVGTHQCTEFLLTLALFHVKGKLSKLMVLGTQHFTAELQNCSWMFLEAISENKHTLTKEKNTTRS